MCLCPNGFMCFLLSSNGRPSHKIFLSLHFQKKEFNLVSVTAPDHFTFIIFLSSTSRLINPQDIHKYINMSNQETDIKHQMVLLDIRLVDFQNCSNLEEEYTAIQRKSGDLKAFCGPAESGYADRIREINGAQRTLKELLEEGKIDSFSQYLREEEDQGGEELKEDIGHDSHTSGDEISDMDLRFL